MSTVEWPSQVARSPVSGALVQTEVGSTDGSGALGTRRSPPQRNSFKVGAGTAVLRNPGSMGWILRNASPAQSNEDFMRSRRKPSGLLPNDFMQSFRPPLRWRVIALRRIWGLF